LDALFSYFYLLFGLSWKTHIYELKLDICTINIISERKKLAQIITYTWSPLGPSTQNYKELVKYVKVSKQSGNRLEYLNIRIKYLFAKKMFLKK